MYECVVKWNFWPCSSPGSLNKNAPSPISQEEQLRDCMRNVATLQSPRCFKQEKRKVSSAGKVLLLRACAVCARCGSHLEACQKCRLSGRTPRSTESESAFKRDSQVILVPIPVWAAPLGLHSGSALPHCVALDRLHNRCVFQCAWHIISTQ